MRWVRLRNKTFRAEREHLDRTTCFPSMLSCSLARGALHALCRMQICSSKGCERNPPKPATPPVLAILD